VTEVMEDLIREHFVGLPNRYAYQVRDALREVLMHVSLLEESRHNKGTVTHCLRPIVANFPDSEDKLVEVITSECPPLDIPDRKAQNKNRMVSATPLTDSTLEIELLREEGSKHLNDVKVSEQDCFELTVAMKGNSEILSKVMQELGKSGLSVVETHGFNTVDGYFLYWFVLDGWGMENLDALDGLLRSRFSMFSFRLYDHVKKAAANEASSKPSLLHRMGMKRCDDKVANGLHGFTANRIDEGEEEEGRAAPSLKRIGSSFLNLWQYDLGVGNMDTKEWELDPEAVHIKQMIGRGSFGKIFKGVYEGQVIAAKYIASDSSQEFDHVKEFMQEIALLSQIKHENIVDFVGACTKQTNVCIVYEYMERGNIRNHLIKAKPKLPKLMDYALAIARGMVYLASKNIIHRDLKAQNILMSKGGEIKIGDFGVARLLVGGEECHTAETGTYRWMAPEVIDHKPYGHAADVYSFGLVLWELVTHGRMPYELLSPVQAAVGVSKHGLRPKIPSSCPDFVSEIMKACWQPAPGDRPTFEEIVVLLEQAKIKAEGLRTFHKASTVTSMLTKMMKAQTRQRLQPSGA